ncbi:hypothetical protein [Leptospira licerasiae]|uniref:Uncharacterized protein n=1 Tax=Leptospira licerasiae str. MMD4847 TaxID=1049971 RepID=A0ABP2RJT6_9LEPT|nr:hypothetical protein [Leptospira licerasiae]EIE01861.1 hypothetical protein LEP1GSC185_0943 [Leptospira licerasiae serovar Varillal str. VAR 010]EJZ43586.1 hypothetical protein LEP1GSC178_3606 [Leptospira licerasiae str. MMD4847]TGM88494.1 hypothetical protein EHR05_13520 [Leptospira licerasiae]
MKPGDILPQAISFENFTLTLFGRELIKFSKFDIQYESDISFKLGKGGEPVSWSVKSYKRSAKATIEIDELKYLIQLAAPFGGDLLKLPPSPLTARCEVEGGTLLLVVPAVKIMKFNLPTEVGSDVSETDMDFAVVSYPIITFS